MDETRLTGIPLFAALSKRERRHVARLADEIDLPEGSRLVREGEFAYEFFVIARGTAQVVRGEQHVADLGPGDFLGEMGVMGNARRNASVVTTSPVTVVVMTAAALRSIARDLPIVSDQLRAAVEHRSEMLG